MRTLIATLVLVLLPYGVQAQTHDLVARGVVDSTDYWHAEVRIFGNDIMPTIRTEIRRMIDSALAEHNYSLHAHDTVRIYSNTFYVCGPRPDSVMVVDTTLMWVDCPSEWTRENLVVTCLEVRCDTTYEAVKP